MRATCRRTDGTEFDVEVGADAVPVIQVGADLFVLRSHVLGFIDNVSRLSGTNELLYHQTEAVKVQPC